MAEVRLQANKRNGAGKGVARKSRAAGRVPAILYGRGMEPVAIEVDRREFIIALNTDAGMNVLLDIEVDGDRTLALTRELQRDPVRGTVLHADFVKIDRKHAIEVDVPIHIVGEAPGTKEGGILETQLFQVHVRCLPTDVPEALEADISSLQIGDSLRVGELPVPDGVEIITDPEEVLVLVATPISEAELEALEAEAGIVQEESDEAIEAAAEEAAAAEEGAAEEADAGDEE